MKKFYDTCALLLGCDRIMSAGEHFYISDITLAELENIKISSHKDDFTKFQARQLCSWLLNNQDLYTVEFLKGSPNGLTNDEKIIEAAVQVRQYLADIMSEESIVFVTADICCYFLARKRKLPVNFYVQKPDEYKGFVVIDPVKEAERVAALFNGEADKQLYNNEYVLIDGKPFVYRNEKLQEITYRSLDSNFFGKVEPLDAYQYMIMDSFYNNQITMIRGDQGSGKTYLSLAYLFKQLEKNKIDKIVIFCNPLKAQGASAMGYTPGTLIEKILDTQIGGILSSKLGSITEVERMIMEGKLELIPFSNIRGYSAGSRTAVYITEGQNLNNYLLSVAIGRLEEGCQMIIEGDLAQVDDNIFDGNKNGMRKMSKVFRGSELFGEVTLQSIYRSKATKMALEMLK